jgi:hypothetical protein
MSLRWVSRALALAGVVFAILAVRLAGVARTELTRGDSARLQGDGAAAILHYRRAARAYVPGAPYGPRALDRLRELARESEEADDTEEALAAWRAVRGSILATRHLVVPYPRRLAEADRRIVALRGETPRPAPLGVPERPRLPWTILALLGWIAWTLGAFVFAQRAIDAEDRVRVGPARVWGTLVVIGFGCFVIGLTLA